MFAMQGRCNFAIVCVDALEKEVDGQLAALCNQPFVADAGSRIMFDSHAGVGCVVNTTGHS